MMLVRRQMMEYLELYPIGTDIIEKYVGRDSVGCALISAMHTISETTGEYEETHLTHAATEVFMRVHPDYRYQKSADGRLYRIAYYDINYNYIGSSPSYNNLKVTDLQAPPPNAAYARYVTHSARSNWNLKIIRIA